VVSLRQLWRHLAWLRSPDPAGPTRKAPEMRLFSDLERNAARCGTFTHLPILAALLALACAQPLAVRVVTAEPPSHAKRYCAWFGDARDGTLYFGESAFWSELRETGMPSAEASQPGPQQIGRFDLARERLLPPLPTGAPAARAGTWDVLVHPNGRLYFTSFFESSGWVDPATGASARFDAAGTGLNELALGPDGQVLASRYGPAGGGKGDGSIVALEPDGRVAAEWTLAPVRGWQVAAKSLAWDPVRRVVWVNTDLLPRGSGVVAHDARVIDLATGRELERLDSPELQFPYFAPDGRGFLAWSDGTRLVLRATAPGAAEDATSGRAILLDPAFPVALDFVQDVRLDERGRVVVTRWSGVVHVVGASGDVRTVTLPRPAPRGLYYTAVTHGDRVCATFCADVTVVCAPLP
jgi:hypothetical protein